MEPSFIYEAKGQTLIIHMPKELDHHSSRNLRYETDLLMAENYVSRMIFDFTKTTFMDSSGVGLIMGRYRKLRPYNGKIIIRGASKQIIKVMKMAGLEKLASFERGDQI